MGVCQAAVKLESSRSLGMFWCQAAMEFGSLRSLLFLVVLQDIVDDFGFLFFDFGWFWVILYLRT